jgi:hypothetical protein
MSLRLRFGAPRANLIHVGIASPSIAFDEVLNANPDNPIDAIAGAALAAAEGRAGSAVLRTQPDEYVLHFEPQGARVRMEIVRRPTQHVSKSTRVFQATGAPHEVLVPVWRGLQELGGRWPGGNGCWSAPFPAHAVTRLGGALGIEAAS